MTVCNGRVVSGEALLQKLDRFRRAGALGGNADTEALQWPLVPAPAQLIQIHPVSTEVNNVRNNAPGLIEEAPLVADD
jgi:hypothetical protein